MVVVAVNKQGKQGVHHTSHLLHPSKTATNVACASFQGKSGVSNKGVNLERFRGVRFEVGKLGIHPRHALVGCS